MKVQLFAEAVIPGPQNYLKVRDTLSGQVVIRPVQLFGAIMFRMFDASCRRKESAGRQ